MKCFPKMGHAWSFTQERESQSIQTHVKTQQNWSEQTSWQTDTEPERLQQLNNKNKKCGQVEIITSTHPESPSELFSNRSSDFSPHCRPHCITWHSLVPLYIQHTWVRFTNITKKTTSQTSHYPIYPRILPPISCFWFVFSRRRLTFPPVSS